MIAGSQAIAELSAICDLRSVIVCDHMETLYVKGFRYLAVTCAVYRKICLLNDILLTVKESPSLITISETRLSDGNVNNLLARLPKQMRVVLECI